MSHILHINKIYAEKNLDLWHFSHYSCIHLFKSGDAVCDPCDGVRETPVRLHPGEHRLHAGHPESTLRGEAQGVVIACTATRYTSL